MSRPIRTPEECRAITQFITYLTKYGRKVIEDKLVVDKPDLVLEENGAREGYELAIITKETFEAWARKPKTNGGLNIYKTDWTPSVFLNSIVEKKRPKAGIYLAERQLSKINLVLHSGKYPFFILDDQTLASLMINLDTGISEFSDIWVIDANGTVAQIQHNGIPLTPNSCKIEEQEVVFKSIQFNYTEDNPMPPVIYLDFRDSEPSTEDRLLFNFLYHAQVGNLEKLKKIIDDGIGINSEDNSGFGALRYAAGNGHFDLVEYVLSKGACPKVEYGEHLNLISLCRQRGYENVAALIERKLKADDFSN